MDNSNIKSYTRSSYLPLFAGAFFLALGIMGFFIDDMDKPFLLVLMMMGFAAVCWIPYFISAAKANNTIEAYESQYGAEALEKDFREARPVIDDKLRMGQEWLYGKRTDTVVRYEQISKIYIYVHRTNGVEDRRSLKIQVGGKDRELCVLPTKGVFKKQNHPDVETIIKVILIKNPSVHIGYK